MPVFWLNPLRLHQTWLFISTQVLPRRLVSFTLDLDSLWVLLSDLEIKWNPSLCRKIYVLTCNVCLWLFYFPSPVMRIYTSLSTLSRIQNSPPWVITPHWINHFLLHIPQSGLWYSGAFQERRVIYDTGWRYEGSEFQWVTVETSCCLAGRSVRLHSPCMQKS